jgi:hypothetical protein
VLDSGQRVQRPIIQLEDGDVYLTRIDPDAPATSMIVRLRPGWRPQWPYLCGMLDSQGGIVTGPDGGPVLK